MKLKSVDVRQRNMDSQGMIVIKGEPVTQQIVSINEDRRGVYRVKFKSGKIYYFSHRDVNILKSPEEISVPDCRISNRRGVRFNPVHIWEYTHFFHKFYRIAFTADDVREYDEDYLNISKSVLADDAARNVFNYLKEVSGVQFLMTENGPISLHDKYEKIDFIDMDTALGRYLCPAKMQKKKGYDHLMFPFYSNLSQMKAVKEAFTSQMSVVQGPPGTGKTQTILNIVANLVARKKNVLIVSNNNSAVENVKEKLDKEGLGFIVAELGKLDNRNDFISKGQPDYPDMDGWKDDRPDITLKAIDTVSMELQAVFGKQNQLAKDRQELAAIEIESGHFFKENDYDKNRLSEMGSMTSGQLVNLWVRLDIKNEEAAESESSLWKRIKRGFQNLLISYRLKKLFGKQLAGKSDDDILMDIKAMFYTVRKEELQSEIDEITDYLNDKHADELLQKQAALSMKALKAALYLNYEGGTKERTKFVKDDLLKKSDAVATEYPVVLSTTFSATSSLPGHVFDYLIMDEASQVPVESATIALSCARNAVIVGDLKQLPNIITGDDKEKIERLNVACQIDDRYNCLKNSFLSSIVKVMPNVPQTLLKEHYRCAPMIINFCNQKFYGGELVIMTKEGDGPLPMKVIRTVRGNHSRSVSCNDKVDVFNQREVDEFMHLKEQHPDIPLEETGIITPYKGQALRFREMVQDDRLEADTIHKYQGREKDIIVMSTVADHYNEFVDNANLINVAVSRAKKEFVLITNGNDNPGEGNIKDLIGYINYNHGKVEDSNLHSIFDLLYSSYTEQRKSYLKGKSRVSEFDSENIAYHVLSSILKKNACLSSLDIISHYHLNALINDTLRLTEEEKQFARASWSHVDFLIENRVSKQPVLVIEVDGFAYHHKGTKQAERDKLKESILSKYNIPLLRLSTVGSGEAGKIETKLYDIIKAD